MQGLKHHVGFVLLLVDTQAGFTAPLATKLSLKHNREANAADLMDSGWMIGSVSRLMTHG